MRHAKVMSEETIEASSSNVRNLVFGFYSSSRSKRGKAVIQIECCTLQKAMRDDSRDLVILDARSPLAFWRGHIEGAVNLPAQYFSPSCVDAIPDCSEVVICGSDEDPEHLADLAAALIERGHHTKLLRGGFPAWCVSGGEIARPKPTLNSVVAL